LFSITQHKVIDFDIIKLISDSNYDIYSLDDNKERIKENKSILKIKLEEKRKLEKHLIEQSRNSVSLKSFSESLHLTKKRNFRKSRRIYEIYERVRRTKRIK